MSREIKYQAWVKKYKEMCRVVALDFEKDKVWVFSETQDNTEEYSFSEVELRRYINIDDIKDMPIYEKDIVKFETKNGWKTRMVEYEDGNLVPMYDGEYIQDEQGNHFKGWGGEFEVIGNKYEHPELMKQIKI